MPICPKCLREYSEADFYGKEVCYRCTYQLKTEKDIPELSGRSCKLCKGPIEEGRSFYCSQKCADKFHEEKKKNAWYLKLKDKGNGWKETPLDFRRLES